MLNITTEYIDKVLADLNSVYVPTINTPHRYQIYYGGAGSGKSRFIAKKKILRQTKYDLNCLVVRNTYKSHKQSTYKALQWAIDDLGMQDVYTKTTSPLQQKLKTSSGVEINYIGLDDVEKIKSIEGVDLIWIEEATEIDYEDFKQLDRRLRGKGKPKQMMLSFNPVDSNHWLKQFFFDNPTKDIREKSLILKTTYRDNKYLDDDYISMLEAETDDYWKAVYTSGDWGTLTDLVFDQSKIKLRDISQRIKDYSWVKGGIDWGFNHAMTCQLVGFDEEKDQNLNFLREVYAKGLTTSEFVNEVKSTIPEWKKIEFVGDSAEPDRIKEFERAGFNITPADKGNGSITHGIDFMRGKYLIVHPDCYNLSRELKIYKWKKINGIVQRVPVNANDDTIDACRYALRDFSLQERSIRNMKNPKNQIKFDKMAEIMENISNSNLI